MEGAWQKGAQDSRNHLRMAVLQSTLEITIGTNLLPLDAMLDGFFLVFVGHVSSGRESGGYSAKVGGGVEGYAKVVLRERDDSTTGVG